MPVTTLRTWVIGLAWAILIPGLNQFFFFRFPSVTINAIVAQLLSFPVGRAAAAWLPDWKILGISINPGPFTVKEHVLITVWIYPCDLVHYWLFGFRLWSVHWLSWTKVSFYPSSIGYCRRGFSIRHWYHRRAASLLQPNLQLQLWASFTHRNLWW